MATTYAGHAAQVQDSWLRCQHRGTDPDATPPVDLISLEQQRAAHPFNAVMPVVRSLLVEHAMGEGLLVAVTDAEGRLLWVEGSVASLRKGDRIHFTSGARWDEGTAGTNAPALALALDRPAQVRGHEHFAHQVQGWSCSAAPLHDPFSGEVLGALDVTGDTRAASTGMLALVRATVAAVERELLLGRLLSSRQRPPGRLTSASRLHLSVLGPAGCLLRVDGVPSHVTLRHAEILLLLDAHPEGLTAEELACQLDERTLDPVTVRVEMSRLRRVLAATALGDTGVLGRPYRLAVPLTSDAAAVREHLDNARVQAAVLAYAGPVLARSFAPGVIRIREALAAELRAGVLDSGNAALLLGWARSPWGVDDGAVWAAVRESASGVARAGAAARLELSEAQLR